MNLTHQEKEQLFNALGLVIPMILATLIILIAVLRGGL